MLEHLPVWLGAMLRNVRAGHDKLVVVTSELGHPATIELSSPAFAAGGRLPPRFTADGEGVSPPLVWGPVPEGTACLALIVEDPDAPAANPLVHAIVWDIPPDEHCLAEGAIHADGAGSDDGDVGRNSFLREGWLPPDPPSGHGEHDYVFQLFALARRLSVGTSLGRAAFVEAIADNVIGTGILVGTYSRGDPAMAGLAGPVPGDPDLATG